MSPRVLPVIRAHRLVAAVLLSALACAAGAQGTEIQFGDGESNADQPVEMTADRLDFDQDAGKAVFTGNVLIVQGELRLSGDVVDVSYGENEAGENEVRRVEARGGVVLVNGEDAAEAESAVYTLSDETVVMTGDVLLTRPDTAITGQTLRIDVNDGSGVMEGRVSIVFTPEEGDGAGAAE